MTQTGIIYRIVYTIDQGRLLLHLLGRDTDGKRIDRLVSGAVPYFFIRPEEASKATGPSAVSVDPGPPDVKGAPTMRVSTRYPSDVRDLKQRFLWHGEADVVFNNRCRGDHRLTYVSIPDGERVPIADLRSHAERPEVTPRILFLDIETEDAYEFAKADHPTQPVLSAAFFDSYRRAYGVVYVGPETDPELVRAAIRAHLPEHVPFDYPIVLFPVANERALIGAVGELLAKVSPDGIAAYNGYSYDFPYLGGRAVLYQGSGGPDADDIDRTAFSLDSDLARNRGVYSLLDPLAIYRKMELRQRSFSLEAVAMEVLGYGKIPRPEKVSELRKKDLVRFLAYNLIDVHLMERIDAKKALIPYVQRIAEIANVEPSDCIHNSRLIDGVLFAEARKDGPPSVALPSKDFAPKDQRTGRAAETFVPIVGRYAALLDLDLEQEYPSIVQTFNIGPDTVVPEGTPDAYVLPTGRSYRKEPLGILARSLFRLKALRDSTKADMRRLPPGSDERARAKTTSEAIKAIVNSAAGVFGSTDYRLGDVAVFEDITGMSRLQLNYNKNRLEDPIWLSKTLGEVSLGTWEGRVIAGDTDSCFVHLSLDGVRIDDPEVLIRAARRLRDALNDSYPTIFAAYGATRNYTTVGIDGVFAPLRTLPRAKGDGTEGAKKRYYGLYAFEGETDVRDLPIEKRIKFVGIEVRRWNNAPITKEVQTGIITRDVGGRPSEEIVRYVDGLTADVLAGKRDEDLLIRTKMSKEREEYGVETDFLKAMLVYSNLSGRALVPGDEYHWTYVDGGVAGPTRSDPEADRLAIPLGMSLVEARSAGWNLAIDRRRMLEKTVTGPARLVFPDLDGSSASLEEY